MSAFPQFGLNYPGLSVTQMMAGAMQPGVHTPSCDVAHARPIMSDPHTGQTICSCQYDRFVRSCLPPVSVNSAAPNMNQLNSAASAAFGPFSLGPNPDHPPPPGMPSFLPGSFPPPPMNGPHDNMALFPGGLLSAGFPDMKEMANDPVFRAAMMAQSGAGGCYPYEPPFGGGMYPPGPYCGNNYSMDPAGLNRRKNATRETTSQLKQWLSEHRKNPYPTKGEKIMLAIMTKMTLTQVSTWFANARRRLKKENKMTWSPRNRGCEDEDKSDGENDGDHENGDDFLDKDDGSLSEISSLTDDNGLKRNGSISPRDTKDSQPNQTGTQPASGCAAAGSVDSVNTPANHASVPVSTKPRIWSLADMAGPGGNSSPHKTHLPPPPDQLPPPPLPLPFPPGAHPQTHPFLARMGLPPGPHPPWSPLFAASAAGSLLQSGALNSQHTAANFFTQNPNSAFSTPGRFPPGLMGPNGMIPPRGPVVSQSQAAVIRVKDEGAEANGPGTPPVKMQRTGNASPSENLRTPHNGPENMSVKIKVEKPSSIVRTVSHPENGKLNDPLQNSPPNSEKKRRRSDSSDSRPLSPVA